MNAMAKKSDGLSSQLTALGFHGVRCFWIMTLKQCQVQFQGSMMFHG